MVRIDEQYLSTCVWPEPYFQLHSALSNSPSTTRGRDCAARGLLAAVHRLDVRCRAFLLVHPECGPITRTEVRP